MILHAWQILIPLLHLLGLAASLHAILTARTPQGAIAWSIALFTFPYLTLPLYLVIGRDRFQGYVQALRAGTLRSDEPRVEEALAPLREHRYEPPPEQADTVRVLEKLARVPFTGGCTVDLLLDGEATYARMHAEIEKARDYILVLFFIVGDDRAGRALKDHLIRKAHEGVRVFFVFDEMGSGDIQGRYLQELRAAGVHAWPFYTTRGWRNRFQLNFRNHRKIVVVDGQRALVGGLNVCDDCLGISQHYGPWRDTHVVIEGPAVMGIQLVFVEDYYWATGGELPGLTWTPHAAPEGDLAAAYLGSGPADAMDVGILFFLECIQSARQRLWLASPYFVPDPSLLDALKMAALRGVDVRIMVPPGKYERHMYLAALSYVPELQDPGIAMFVYPGYNHSKVMLVDDWLAWVGSANLDNRSLRLNFEGNLIVAGQEFAGRVEEMLARDFSRSRRLTRADVENVGALTLLGSKIARLFAPIL